MMFRNHRRIDLVVQSSGEILNIDTPPMDSHRLGEGLVGDARVEAPDGLRFLPRALLKQHLCLPNTPPLRPGNIKARGFQPRACSSSASAIRPGSHSTSEKPAGASRRANGISVQSRLNPHECEVLAPLTKVALTSIFPGQGHFSFGAASGNRRCAPPHPGPTHYETAPTHGFASATCCLSTTFVTPSDTQTH